MKFTAQTLLLATLLAPALIPTGHAACIAQDNQYSYEGADRGSALGACRRASAEPCACYVERCAPSDPRKGPRRLTKDEIRNINDAILQQRCLAGGICRP